MWFLSFVVLKINVKFFVMWLEKKVWVLEIYSFQYECVFVVCQMCNFEFKGKKIKFMLGVIFWIVVLGGGIKRKYGNYGEWRRQR